MTIEVNGEIKLSPYESVLVIPVKSRERAAKAIEEQANAKYPLTIEIKQKRPKRSLNANAYAWVLIGDIAEALNLSNYAVYEVMLQRYSKAYTYIIVKPEAVAQTQATLKDAHIYAYPIGDKSVDGKDGVQLQLYWGSSTFDTSQMARLIDGIISEAQELGIDTKTPDEIAKMKMEWKP